MKKVLAIFLIILGLILITTEDEQEKPKKIKYKGKYKDENVERLVEIIDPNYEIKYPKKN
jgi:hypothetical protein